MKIYLITDEQQEELERQRDSLIKTKSMCDLMLDIATQSGDLATFDAALEIANTELDRLEVFFDMPDLCLR
ncbi:hypothetical protein ACQE3E_00385 [Methylomonas sp. MED-D]|uniref:hypothetical protein n=1 Tax=unclassified Methylomonas TaxID=2608980 RepID=UPI0008D9E282|nr:MULTISPECIES: hypothetical protein [unclassified Methylomonas]MDT4330636.1 hypothetical protein [Methylomonas sp. MV1]NJA06011.1 hypothetical protein [Methylococcaceae bacterium WWC4]OHX34751.1 hypothetical protein BJL95_11690 [Methylomonas sp. LWB]